MSVRRDRRRVNVDQAERRVERHQVPAAELAVFAIARFGFVENGDVLLALRT
jgi:hypothetical protein